jgi:thiol-disulfide isomerase/thioredoxin
MGGDQIVNRLFASITIIFLLQIADKVPAFAARPAPASAILAEARREATATHRNVFVFFHASWCGWCKRLDAFLESLDVKKAVEENYIVVRLDVMEHTAKEQALENPGGRELMASLGGGRCRTPLQCHPRLQRRKDRGLENDAGRCKEYRLSRVERGNGIISSLSRQIAARIADHQRAEVISNFGK